MTDDHGAAALAERLHIEGMDRPRAMSWAAAILGEHGRFLPDGSATIDDLRRSIEGPLEAEVERLRGLLGRLVSLGWLMDSLPDDELAHDLYNYDRLSPEPKP